MNVSIMDPVIQHGTWTIITVRDYRKEAKLVCKINIHKLIPSIYSFKVPQGQIGLAFDRGQPVLFPPGLHQWDSQTLKFKKCIDLCQPVIEMGPYTLLTVDEG